MAKKGDTLIEVTLAVGIFSMIAIAIVAVMSGGTSNAQTALETTLTREEIDTQAEALRFIHSSYVVDRKNADKTNKYAQLWKEITSNAISDLNPDSDENADVLQFAPQNCGDLYNDKNSDSLFQQKAFVINPRMLGKFDKETIGEVYVPAKAGTNTKFVQAMTYPHLIYGMNKNDLDEEKALSISPNEISDNLIVSEGLYVVAVRDHKTTAVVENKSDVETPKKSAFYDFYIRACWYGSNADRASSISTVIRLYDPDAV